MTMLKTWLSTSLLLAGLTLAACVTINVYFPAAAAERAADRIIDDVWGTQPQPPATPPATPTSRLPQPAQLLVLVLDALIAPAHAETSPNIDLSSPEIARLKAQMENRFAELKPQLDAGVIGLTADGDVTIRDPAQVPLASRNAVRALVANENADRAALYREIARVNEQPQWEAQIRNVFASRWIARAAAGWWYQDANGAWKQK